MAPAETPCIRGLERAKAPLLIFIFHFAPGQPSPLCDSMFSSCARASVEAARTGTSIEYSMWLRIAILDSIG